jgi:hypothetical protein
MLPSKKAIFMDGMNGGLMGAVFFKFNIGIDPAKGT